MAIQKTNMKRDGVKKGGVKRDGVKKGNKIKRRGKQKWELKKEVEL